MLFSIQLLKRILLTVKYRLEFVNGLGDLGSIPGRVIPKTKKKKWYLIPTCLTLSNIRYVSRVKWSNSGKGVAPSPTLRCSSNWKGSLLVALDYVRQLYNFYYRLRTFTIARTPKLTSDESAQFSHGWTFRNIR